MAVSVNLTIYDPAIVTNIVRWSGNDKFGAPSLFCFSHPPPPPSPPNSVVDTEAKTEFEQQYNPREYQRRYRFQYKNLQPLHFVIFTQPM